MYYHVAIEKKEKGKTNKYIYEIDFKDEITIINDIIKPYLLGDVFLFSGYTLQKEQIERIRVFLTKDDTKTLQNHKRLQNQSSGVVTLVTQNSVILDKGLSEDITKSLFEKVNLEIKGKETPTMNIKTTEYDDKSVFIVHGHDELAKEQVARFIESLDLRAIILHELANNGDTIIEKIEKHTNVGFGIALYTPCDVGESKENKNSLKPRARQNVVFEHGYLIGKLGRNRVIALVKGDIETPNDLSGVVYINMSSRDDWKISIVKELVSIGYKIDTSKLFS